MFYDGHERLQRARTKSGRYFTYLKIICSEVICGFFISNRKNIISLIFTHSKKNVVITLSVQLNLSFVNEN